jgi:anhydro-N-acetylmuramic acid kinase
MTDFSKYQPGQKVIGMMSGTSLDGVDAALLRTDGQDIAIPGPNLTIPYNKEMRAILRAALDEARKIDEARRTASWTSAVPQSIREAERLVTEAHAGAVKTLLALAGLTPADIALIGFHGQTILHRPQQHWTWQIGDGALLAKLTGIDVVNDFRSADVRAGGQGAPLMPLYHAALLKRSILAPPLVIVNIGGVAQVTYINGDTVLAFDTGPGNAPIDDWMHHHSGQAVDMDGAFAAFGKVDFAALTEMLANPFFERPPPKSLDRLDFGTEAVRILSPTDGAATLTAFTAASIARAREFFPEPATTWIVTGGGRHNKTLMAALKARVNVPVIPSEDLGWNGDAMEAEGFAYLAMRAQKGLPLSLPSTTGVQQPMTGGKLYRKP